MNCPACGSDNPVGASRCTCGHELPIEALPMPGVRGPSFHGEGGALFGIYIVNLLLTIVTLGVFYFWGKTRVRRYMYSQAAFGGDRFTYHGTGMELLIG